MNGHFIAEGAFEVFFGLLRMRGELLGPLRCEDGAVRFAQIKAGDRPDFSALRTLLPPKKYLLHPQETLLTYQAGSGYRDPEQAVSPRILLGLHPCDLAAISYLDMMFNGDNPDRLYATRRNSLTLIGSSCTPDAFCSCQLIPSPLKASCDLFLQHIDGGCLVSSSSERGDELMVMLKEHAVFEERVTCAIEDTRRFFGQQVTPPLSTEPDSDCADWQRLAEHCAGCGACSICCPTCYCFDVLEQAALDGSSAERLRRWDSCLFSKHGEIAGGTNFQKDHARRFRYRFRHKHQGFGALQGVPGCVGCGRCQAGCPAELDLRPLTGLLTKGLP